MHNKARGISRRDFVRHSMCGAGLLSVVSVLPGKGADANKQPNPFGYDVERLTKTDPNLIAFEQVARFRPSNPTPRRIAAEWRARRHPPEFPPRPRAGRARSTPRSSARARTRRQGSASASRPRRTPARASRSSSRRSRRGGRPGQRARGRACVPPSRRAALRRRWRSDWGHDCSAGRDPAPAARRATDEPRRDGGSRVPHTAYLRHGLRGHAAGQQRRNDGGPVS